MKYVKLFLKTLSIIVALGLVAFVFLLITRKKDAVQRETAESKTE